MSPNQQIMEQHDSESFDPDNFVPRPRRHTDQPRPIKPTALPTLSVSRPRTGSFNAVSVSLDTSGLSLVSNGHNKVQIKADKSLDAAGEAVRPRRGSGVEISKRVLALAVPHKRTVYTKDLELVDTKVKLSHLRVQWPLSAVSERKSKSASRNRLISPEEHRVPVKTRKSEKPSVRAQPVPPRCISEHKRRAEEPDTKKTHQFKGPSDCNPHAVDLLLVRRYNEDQQHLLATIRDFTSGKLEPHSILRCRMQEYAPWTACDLPAEERIDKAVHFI